MTLRLSTGAVTLVAGDTTRLLASAFDASGKAIPQSINWTSANSSVAAVADGLITAVGPGTTRVTATAHGVSADAAVTVSDGGIVTASGGTIADRSGVISVVIPAGAVDARTAIPISAAPATPNDSRLVSGTAFSVGDGLTFSKPISILIRYATSNIPSGRTETQLRLGRASSGAWSGFTGSADATSKSVIGTTTQGGTFALLAIDLSRVATVHIVPGSAALAAGSNLKLTTVLHDSVGTDIATADLLWTSSDSTVATVGADGTVKALRSGITTIVASAGSAVDSSTITVIGAPSRLAVAAGDDQRGTAQQRLGIDPVVVVYDINNLPIAGVPVAFDVKTGGGSVTNRQFNTDTQGRAAPGGWTLGAVGAQSLSASVAGSAVVAATINAQATPAVGTVLAPHTVALDTLLFHLLTAPELVDGSALDFEVSAGAPTINVGDVIYGPHAGGILRRVSVATRSGSRLSLITTPAVITDLVDSAQFNVTGQFSTGTPASQEQRRREGLAIEDAIRMTGVAAVRAAAMDLQNFNLFQANLCTPSKSACITGSATILSAHLGFDPQFQFRPEISLFSGLKSLDATATGALGFDGTVQLSARVTSGTKDGLKDGVKKEFSGTIGPAFERTFPVPNVPLLIATVRVEFPYTFSATFNGEGSITSGISTNANVSVGLRYRDGQWSSVRDVQSATQRESAFDGSLSAGFRLDVQPRVTFRLEELPGPRISYGPFIGVNASVDFVNCKWSSNGYWGLTGNLGWEPINFFGFDIKFDGITLPGPEGDIWRRTDPLPAVSCGLRLEQVSGDGQRGGLLAVLPQDLTVRVRNINNQPVSGIAVAFAPSTGDGKVYKTLSVTDANGIASSSARLGSTASVYTFTASAPGLTGSPISFAATAIASTPTAAIKATLSSGASATNGQPLSTTVAAGQRAAVDFDGGASASGSSTLTITKWAWTQDGTSLGSTQKVSANLAPSNNPYSIKLVVTNSAGQTAEATQSVTVTQAATPTATFSLSGLGTTVSSGNTLTLHVNSGATVDVALDAGLQSGISAYSWSVDGRTLSAQRTFVVALGVGKHTVGLSITGTGGVLATATAIVDVTETSVCSTAGALVSQLPAASTTEQARTTFHQSWTLRNSGSCTWTPAFQFRSSRGAPGPLSSALVAQGLPRSVAPGDTITLGVDLQAPSVSGTYREDWSLLDAVGGNVAISGAGTIFSQIVVAATQGQAPHAGFTMRSGSASATEGGTLSITVARGAQADVALDAARSTATGSTITAYEWRVNGSTIGRTTPVTIPLAAAATPYQLELIVTNALGATDRATGVINATSAATASPPTISSISPTTPTASTGNQTLSVTGTGFQAGLTVTVIFPDGGTSVLSGTQIQSLSQTSFQMIATLNGAGLWGIRVNNPDGQQSGVLTFNVVAPVVRPSISSVSPSSYPASNNLQTMTINGSNFVSGATLVFVPAHGNPIASTASRLSFVSSGQLSYQFNNGSDAGSWTVEVVNPNGQTSGPFSFTVTATTVAPLAVTSINPSNPTSSTSNQTVTVNGTGFQSGLTVTLFFPNNTGSSNLTGLQIQNVSSTSFQMVAMLNGAGTWGIRVNNADGRQSATYAFNVSAPAAVSPSISSISPSSYPASNALQTMTINGSNFQSGATLTFTPAHGSPIASTASRLTFVSSSQLTYQFNNGSDAGSWSVSVTNPDGRTSSAAGFTVTSTGPTISSISPSTPVSSTSNQTINVNGSGFQAGLTVTVFFPNGAGSATLSGTQIQSVSATSFQAIAVLNGAGSWGIRVNNPDGQQSATYSFNVSAPAAVSPSISSISPSSYPASNSLQTMTINGSNFQSGATLTFTPAHGSPIASTASRLTFVSSSQLVYQINNGSDAGSWSVSVTNPDGRTSSAAGFTVTSAAPTISSISPSTPTSSTSNQTISVSGSGFQSGLTVTVFFPNGGGSSTLSGTQIQSVSATSFQAIAVLNGAGSWGIRVNNPDGQQSTTYSFNVNAPAVSPSISSISPSSYPASNSLQTMTINGSNFQSGAYLTFFPAHGSSITSTAGRLTFLSSSQLTYQINNGGDAGSWSVAVTNPDGRTSSAAGFVVTAPAPSISGISPSSPTSSTANQTVTVSGSGFQSGLTVTVVFPNGGISTLSGTQIRSVTSSSFQMVAVLNGAGLWGIRVNNPDGTSSGLFTFNVH